jgi:DNA polymerase-1
VSTYSLLDADGLSGLVDYLVADPPPFIGYDTETTGLARWKDSVIGFSIAPQWGTAFYVPLDHGIESVDFMHAQRELRRLLAVVPVVCHGAAFDTAVTARLLGIEPWEIDVAHCTLLMAQVLGERSEAGKDTSASLKGLAKRYLGVTRPTFSDLFPPKTKKKDKDLRKLDLDIVTDYAAADADDVLGLVQVFEPLIAQQAVESTYNLEVTGRTPTDDPRHRGQGNVLHEILWMESAGVVIDKECADQHAARCRQFAFEAEQAILARLGERLGRPLPDKFNLSSPDQLRPILFAQPPEGLGLPVLKMTAPSKKHPEGQASTDESVLSSLAVHEPALLWLLEMRGALKAVGTYFEPIPNEHAIEVDGQLVVYPNIKQLGTETGRTSSDEPNMQNQPKEQSFGVIDSGAYKGHQMIPGVAPITVNARDMVVARPGHYFIEMDWGQVEYRAIGGLSGDPGLLDTFARNVDLHVSTYALMNGVPMESVSKPQRHEGKTMNYALNFGAGKNRVAGMLGCSPADADQKISKWRQAFPMVALWKEQTEEFAKRYRYVQTLFGRKRWLNFGGEGVSEKAARAAYFAALREAVNMPVQGVCADLLKITLVRLGPWLRTYFAAVRTLLTVHDSFLFELPNEIEPVYFIDSVRPVVEWPANFLPGWPAIVSDFSIGHQWGSLVEQKDLSTPQPVTHEVGPTAPITLTLRIGETVTQQQTAALSELIAQMPGVNTLRIELEQQGQTIDIPGVGIGPGDAHLFAHILTLYSLHAPTAALGVLVPL